MPSTTGNSDTLYIRTGVQQFLFARYDHVKATSLDFCKFPCRTGISANANMHDALRKVPLAHESYHQVNVSVTGDVTLVPLNEFDDEDAEDLYFYNLPEGRNRKHVYFDMLPRLNAMMLFAIDKDLEHTILETFPQATFHAAQMPLVLHWRSLAASGEGHIFVGWQEGRLTVCAFRNRELDLLNSYKADNVGNALYYTLALARQWGIRPQEDHVWLCGEAGPCENLRGQLSTYLQNVAMLQPAEEYSPHIVPYLKDITYDMLALLFRAY